MVDQPLQYFFSKDANFTEVEKQDHFDLSKALEAAGVTNTVKLVVVPKEKDVLFSRLENMADLDSGVGSV